MISSLLPLVPALFALVVFFAIQIAFIIAVLRARRAARVRARAESPSEFGLDQKTTTVSILKPLAGSDDDLDANLASFATIDYPSFEILFGVASASDPALTAARRFVEANPHVHARIFVTDPDAAINPKVAQLILLEAHARGDVIVVSDSNVRVNAGYLKPLVRELDDPRVGLVTSIFAGTGEQTLGAALENLQLGANVTPGIVAYNVISKSPLTLGKSMGIRRRDLADIGGFRRVGGVLAEDYAMGRIILERGFTIRTSLDAVENRNVEGGIYRLIERHTRWAKMRRAIAPTSFLFEPLLSPLVMATLMLAVSPTRAQIALALATAVIQTAVGFLALRILRGTTLAWYYAPLEIVRTYVAFGCWAVAFISRRVVWRGHPFLVGAGSELQPVPVVGMSRRFVE